MTDMKTMEDQAAYIKRLEARNLELQTALVKACAPTTKDPRGKMFANLAQTLAPEPREPTAEELATIDAERKRLIDDAHARFPMPKEDCKQISCDFITIDPDGFGSVNDGAGDADSVRKFILAARELCKPTNDRLGRMHVRFAVYPVEPVVTNDDDDVEGLILAPVMNQSSNPGITE